MNKVYRIFLSSTKEDLENHRKALLEKVVHDGHLPLGMELFNPGNRQDLDVIQRAIDQCDIYVVLLGSRFGSVIPDSSPPVSFTRVEYEYALRRGKPILAFVQKEAEYQQQRRDLHIAVQQALPDDDRAIKLRQEVEHDRALLEFREYVKDRRRIVGEFRHPRQRYQRVESDLPRSRSWAHRGPRL
jgi:nucleoside 2-deoxyribosyltransferase